jgi:hypothetical protein
MTDDNTTIIVTQANSQVSVQTTETPIIVQEANANIVAEIVQEQIDVEITQGLKGDKGDAGAAGAQGAKGDKGDTGEAGVGLPTGGNAGQVLTKNSNANYDTNWLTLGTAAAKDISYFATAAQGSLAATALQPSALNGYATQSYVASSLSPYLTAAVAAVTYQPAGSYLSAVSASGPLSGDGTAASPLVIAKASGSTSGYLSNTDWNIFNNKGSGTVTGATDSSLTLTSTTLKVNLGNSNNFSTVQYINYTSNGYFNPNSFGVGAPNVHPALAPNVEVFFTSKATGRRALQVAKISGQTASIVQITDEFGNAYFDARVNGDVSIGSLLVGGNISLPGINTYSFGTNSTSDLRVQNTSSGQYPIYFKTPGDLTGFNNTNPQALIHGIKTSEQLRLGCDPSNYLSFVVGSTGNAAINPTGSGAGITVNNNQTINNSVFKVASSFNIGAGAVIEAYYNGADGGRALLATDGSFNDGTFKVVKTTGPFASNSNVSGCYISATFQHSDAGGAQSIGNGFRVVASNNTASAGNLFGLDLSSTANTAGATAIGARITAASTSGTAIALRLAKTTSFYSDMSISGTGDLIINCTGTNPRIILSKPLQQDSYTVALLPTGINNMRTFVTDALAPVWGAVVVGGGAVRVPVYYDGAWKVG